MAVFAGAGLPIARAAEGDAEAHVRAHRPDGRAEHLGAKQAAYGERLVAQHLAGGTEARATRHETVVGVLLVELGDAGRGLTIGAGVQEQSQHLLRVPAALDEFRGEPVQQLGVQREIALAAELFARADDAHAEDRFPEAVHGHAGGEGIIAADDPESEAEAVLRVAGFPAGEARGHAFADLVAEGLPVAAELHEGLAALIRR